MTGIGNWRTRPVAEMCSDIIDCVNKTAPTVEEATPFKMIRTTNVRDGWVDLQNVKFVEEEVFDRWVRRGKPQRGDVILTREAPLGAVGMLRSDEQVFLGQRTVMYRVDDAEADERFLLYALMSPWVQAEIKSLGSGATVEHMRVPDCERLSIPSPPLQVQKQIGAALGSFDDLIENNRRRIEILEEMARVLYREWFVHFRFPGHEDVEMVDSELGPIPDGWDTLELAEYSSYINRGIAPKYSDDSESIVINQRCIRDGRLTLDKARRHIKKVPSEKVVQDGDVLINSTGVGTLGRVAPVRSPIENATADSHVTIVRPPVDEDRDFFAEMMLSLQKRFEAMGVGSTGQTELGRARVGEVKVLRPSGVVTAAFGSLVGPMRQLHVNLTRQNRVLREARDLLLPRLVSGELDVSELDLDEVPV